MSTHRQRTWIAPAAGLLVGLGLLPLVGPTAGAQSNAVATPNMSHVANLEYSIRAGFEDKPDYGDAAGVLELAPRSQGTDLEVTSMVVDRGDGPETRDIVFAGSYRNGLQMIDVTDPTSPVIVHTYDCAAAQGDVQVFHRTIDGVDRTYVAYGVDDISGDALFSSECFADGVAMAGYTGLPQSTGDGQAINDDGGIYGTFIIDVTNPYATTGADRPHLVGWARWPHGSHNTTVDPSGRYIFNSNQDLEPAVPTDGYPLYSIEVFSIGDPDANGMFGTLDVVNRIPLNTGTGPHDITFNATGDRAYVAAISHTVVLDTTDPEQASVIGVIEDPAISIHHQADPITIDTSLGERTFVVISDELAGVIQGAGACPGGGLHIYDVTGDLERTPVKVGYFAIPQVTPAGQYHLRCTAHVFRAYDNGLMTIAWYGAGVRVLDLNGLAGVSVGVDGVGSLGTAPVSGIREIGSIYFPAGRSPETDRSGGSQTWSAKALRFEADGSAYIFANDLDRGFDVYRFDGTQAPGAPTGTWLTPEQALDTAIANGVLAARASATQSLPYCVVLAERS